MTVVSARCQLKWTEGPFDFGDENPGSLNRVIDSLVRFRDALPPEYREKAFCVISSVTDPERGSVPYISVGYEKSGPSGYESLSLPVLENMG